MNVLITGTSKGFGNALASFYLDRGHTVYGLSRSRNQKLDSYQRFRYLQQDLSDFNAMKKKIPDFIKDTGELDIAILNAGILPEIKDMKDCSLEEINKVMDINVWSNKILIDIMFSNIPKIKQIVAVSSGAAVYGSRGWNSYSLSKAALNMLIQLYSDENKGTHFSAIAPGLIDTDMQAYISSMPYDSRYLSLESLKKARGTSQMPGPDEAAKIFVQAAERALGNETGIFIDVRSE